MIKHNKTQDLLLYWTRKKANQDALPRIQIKPRDIKVLLPNLFILHRIDESHFIFRLSGTSLCHHFGREFRDHNFLDLWEKEDRNHMRQILEHVLHTKKPAIIHCRAQTLDYVSIEAELLLLPIANSEGITDRVLGSAHALTGTKALAGRKLVRQKILHATHILSSNDNIAVVGGQPSNSDSKPDYLRLVTNNSAD